MLLEIRCKQGKLQVSEEGVMRVRAPFNKIIWQVNCADVTGFTMQSGQMGSVNIAVHPTRGINYAEMVTKPNFARIQALFPQLATVSIEGREWYHDLKTRTHIETYDNQKKMQRDMELAYQYGWTIQGQNGIGSHINVGRTATKFILTGGIGMMTGASRSKEKTTLTFLRTPEWLAQNA